MGTNYSEVNGTGGVDTGLFGLDFSGTDCSAGCTTNVIDGTLYETTQLQTSATFSGAGWDIGALGNGATVWEIDAGAAYPILPNSP